MKISDKKYKQRCQFKIAFSNHTTHQLIQKCWKYPSEKKKKKKRMRLYLLTKFLRNSDRVNTAVTNTVILGVVR